MVLSGTSKVYVEAKTFEGDSVFVRFTLRSHPGPYRRIKLQYKDTYAETETWRGYLLNSKELGLKSYDLLGGEMEAYFKYPEDNDTTIPPVQAHVCLPNVKIDPDTVFINHDTLKISKNVKAYTEVKDDSTHGRVDINDFIDSVGYRYRSRWVANENLGPSMDSAYVRHFPRDTSYVRWDGTSDPVYNCPLIFRKDSLAVVGGQLSIDAIGALKAIPNYDNSFKISTDSIAGSDTIRTHKILIDSDPSNTDFNSYFNSDRIRAIAWQEYAGSGDPTHCNLPRYTYNPRWNHYWDDRNHGSDTCRDTHAPCENTISTATGIMQTMRRWWESQFNGTSLDGPVDSLNGRPFYCKWDSMAWNWKANIHKGDYIYYKYLPKKYDPRQLSFPDSCPFSDCDTFPTQMNKADLRVYGYTRGCGFMKLIITQDDWNKYIAVTKKPIPDYAIYVQNVRKYYYRRPWR